MRRTTITCDECSKTIATAVGGPYAKPEAEPAIIVRARQLVDHHTMKEIGKVHEAGSAKCVHEAAEDLLELIRKRLQQVLDGKPGQVFALELRIEGISGPR